MFVSVCILIRECFWSRFEQNVQHVDPFCVCCVRILQNPELAPHISIGEMGKLLPEEVLGPLEEQYLSRQQVAPSEPLSGFYACLQI